jgi:hypothetical protein
MHKHFLRAINNIIHVIMLRKLRRSLKLQARMNKYPKRKYKFLVIIIATAAGA